MATLNVEPIITFADGSRLLLSTEYVGEASFRCELYLSSEAAGDTAARFRLVTPYLIEAGTCLAAQNKAYSYATRLYPEAACDMKKPPYLIWRGPQRP
ncbi:hypothetical protein [Candidatus Nitrospira bockiana]